MLFNKKSDQHKDFDTMYDSKKKIQSNTNNKKHAPKITNSTLSSNSKKINDDFEGIEDLQQINSNTQQDLVSLDDIFDDEIIDNKQLNSSLEHNFEDDIIDGEEELINSGELLNKFKDLKTSKLNKEEHFEPSIQDKVLDNDIKDLDDLEDITNLNEQQNKSSMKSFFNKFKKKKNINTKKIEDEIPNQDLIDIISSTDDTDNNTEDTQKSKKKKFNLFDRFKKKKTPDESLDDEEQFSKDDLVAKLIDIENETINEQTNSSTEQPNLTTNNANTTNTNQMSNDPDDILNILKQANEEQSKILNKKQTNNDNSSIEDINNLSNNNTKKGIFHKLKNKFKKHKKHQDQQTKEIELDKNLEKFIQDRKQEQLNSIDSFDFYQEVDSLTAYRPVDSMLECLLFLAKHYDRPASAESLTAGLAIYDSVMSPKMFIQSSKRIGLISKIVQRDIKNISTMALPSVIIIGKNRAAVLLELDIKNDKAVLIVPDISIEGETVIPISRLEEIYTGYNILIKPSYSFKSRVSKAITITRPKHWFFGTLKKNKWIYGQVVLAAIFINIFVLAMPMFTMNVYDRVLPNNATDTLIVFVSGILVVMIFDFSLKLMRSHFIETAGKKADVIMSSLIFDQVLNIKMNSKPASTGSFANSLQSFESIREFFTSATIAALVDLPFVFLFISIIFYIGGPLAYISLATLVIAITFAIIMQKPLRKLSEASSKESQIKHSTLVETVSGLEIIKVVRAQNRMRTHWEHSITQTAYFDKKTHFYSQLISFFTAFISQASSIAIVGVGVYLAKDGDITMGAIVASMMLNGRVVAPVSQLVGMITRYDKSMVALENIDNIMNMEVERPRDKHFLSRPDLKGDIVFKDVSFAYKDQNFDVLKNINLRIKHGEKVAIIGRIGSGKSTLGKMLMNLYEPTKGSIMIDGTDIRQIDPVDLRKAIGCVPQEIFLFMGTVRDNISIGERIVHDKEVLHAAKLAGVHDFIGKHESGYDLIIGERGEGLSGGERQSIALARALISNPNILIMDEPTNSMDTQTEAIFKRKMQNVIKDKTLILITHRPSVLSLVDRIIVIDDGRVAADGPKEQVLKLLSGKK